MNLRDMVLAESVRAVFEGASSFTELPDLQMRILTATVYELGPNIGVFVRFRGEDRALQVSLRPGHPAAVVKHTLCMAVNMAADMEDEHAITRPVEGYDAIVTVYGGKFKPKSDHGDPRPEA